MKYIASDFGSQPKALLPSIDTTDPVDLSNTDHSCIGPSTASLWSSFRALRGSSGLTPLVFTYSNFWQHELSLLDFLSCQYGGCRLDTLGGSYGWPVRYRQVEDYARLNINTLGQYIKAFQEGGLRLPYLRHLSLNRALPAVHQYLREPAQFRPNWIRHPLLDRFSGPELFIGQAGTVFGNVHQDQVGVHVGFVQLQGIKEFVLFPPDDGHYLYRFAGRQFPFELRNSAIHYSELENYERFPLLRNASPQRIVLQSGEAMLLPSDWWHTTRNLTDSISYNVRIINNSNIARAFWRHLEGLALWKKYVISQPQVR